MNKTIKIIDLLNKIANGEEIPRVEYDDIECYLGADGYLKDDYGENVEWWIDKNWLNKEVEIIEDNDKIKKIKTPDFSGLDIRDKINEIIDHINKIEEKLDEK